MVTRSPQSSPTALLRPRGASGLLVADVDATLAELDRLDPDQLAALMWARYEDDPGSVLTSASR